MTAALTTTPDASPGEPGGSPVWMERAWTGREVTYTLHSPIGSTPLSAQDLATLGEWVTASRNSEAKFVEECKRAHASPDRFGLVQVADDSYGRPDGDIDDPYLTWESPRPGTSRRTPLDGEWALYLPLRTRFPQPPVATVAWDDPVGIERLAQMALNPDRTWAFYALGHPEIVTEHQQKTAALAEEQQQRQRKEDNDRRNREAWRRLRTLAEVPADTVRRLLRDAHVGDSTTPGDAVLRLESLPLPYTLLDHPEVRDRVGFAGAHVSKSATVGYMSGGEANHPVLGWRLWIGTYQPQRYVSTLADPAQEEQGAAWAARVAVAVTSAGLSVVYREDGWWIIRDEAVFDLHHPQMIEELRADRFARRRSREIDIPKRVTRR